jgi:hypothetical protein
MNTRRLKYVFETEVLEVLLYNILIYLKLCILGERGEVL